jgi:glycosyltransferase involved in cell wall biosynthesis
MRIDLHLHSSFSKRPPQWVLQKIGCPESFSRPETLLRLVRKKGMDALTLTDHNTIAGCLEIAHLPDTFISEEVTTYFPQNGCKVHVLVYDIDESIHADIGRLRKNIYDLCAYLNAQKILHAVAHPMYAVNNRLTVDLFEQLLVLFKTLELNGTRDEAQNRLLRAVVGGLTRADLERLADKHGLEPVYDQPWRKHLIGGSDDHSSLGVARIHTEVEGAAGIDEFLDGVRSGAARPRGQGSTPRTLAHHLYGIAYQYFNSRLNLDRFAGRDVLMRFLDRILQPEPRTRGLLAARLKIMWGQRRRDRRGHRERIQNVLWRESERLITTDEELHQIVKADRPARTPGPAREAGDQWFRFVERVSNNVLGHSGQRLVGRLSGANVFSLFDSIGAAGSLFFLLGPYFISYGLYGRDRVFSRQVIDRFIPPDPNPRTRENDIRVAHFTDTYFEINGVARTLRQQAGLAERLGKDLTMITCHPDPPPAAERVKTFRPVTAFDVPEYPQQQLVLPPFLEILDHVYEQGYTMIHTATPGPVGLCALAVARCLNLPILGTYHTQFPQYTAQLTGDPNIGELTWHYVTWYYSQLDKVYVPSAETGEELIGRGISRDKITLYPRGVDGERFNPRRRRRFFQERYGVGDEVKLLYVGRVSREKNLPLLAEAFRELAARITDVHLLVVGDGPYLEDMRQDLAGCPVTFTGYLEGTDLAEAYASADLFVFPSTTDTFGNVVLEAQASGLPVVVTDQGGPRENLIPGRTGLVVPGGDVPALIEAIDQLVSDPDRRRKMGQAAREYMRPRTFEGAFLEQWRLYTQEDFAAGALDAARDFQRFLAGRVDQAAA